MSNSVSHKTRYTVTSLCFVLLFLFTLFLFSRRALEPSLSLYRPSFWLTKSQTHSSNATPVREKLNPPADNETVDNVEEKKREKCDLYSGTWVKDDGYPIYKPGSCPYVDEAFDCQSNGRSDSDYLRWRWKPDGCDLPRFNATDFLERLRGKSLMLVGDSMNRNQFESLLCLLREGLTNKSKMYEVHGYKITKERGHYIFKFEDYNCTVVYVLSHFLVKEGVRINEQGNLNPTLLIDKIDKTSDRWKRADILVFNTAHWWVHGKTARGYITDLTMVILVLLLCYTCLLLLISDIRSPFSPPPFDYNLFLVNLFTSTDAF